MNYSRFAECGCWFTESFLQAISVAGIRQMTKDKRQTTDDRRQKAV